MISNCFKDEDVRQIKAKGIEYRQVEDQLQQFIKGIPFENIQAPASIDYGIVQLNEEKKKEWIKKFENSSSKKVKFVPTSGAATRMFKDLFYFVEQFNPQKESLKHFLERTNNKDLKQFFQQKEKLPFYKKVIHSAKLNYQAEGDFAVAFVKNLLQEENLGYGSFPKGLIPFHAYKNETLTPFEIHFLEATHYAQNNKVGYLHFTVAEKHIKKFKKAQKEIEEKHSDNSFKVDYSYQLEKTDTLAVTLNNKPFRNKNGELLFRPGGHGSLIENLNKIDADIIFIKNIDNVCIHQNLNKIIDYKKALGGYLLEVQNKVFNVLKYLEAKNPNAIDETSKILKSCFHKKIKIKDFTEAKRLLNRPIRVCGMVKNEGAPGGGPFWVKDKDGHLSLQIVESAQIDKNNTTQQQIVAKATHFNPVDLVCGVKNYKGEKFNLLDYVDASKGFITEKSTDGNKLKALELPGLWNGAMAHWNTIFVEVPLVTFNPVKSVVDLLKPTHQPLV